MLYRLVGKADEQADAILLKSEQKWGFERALRYNRLFLAAFKAIAANPAVPGSQPIDGLDSLRSYHLRLARRSLPAKQRVGEPRHVVIYRVANDGTVEIIGFAHDRQLLGRAAKRAQQHAGS